MFQAPGVLPVLQRGLQLELAREGQPESVEKREVWPMDGGGGITAQPHTILGPVLWGAGAAQAGAGSTSLVGTPCCTDPSGEEGHAGKVEQGEWMWLQPGTGLSWKVNKPMRIAAMPITSPACPTGSNTPGPPLHSVPPGVHAHPEAVTGHGYTFTRVIHPKMN